MEKGWIGKYAFANNALSNDEIGRKAMEDGYLSADADGRAKMADGFITLAKLESPSLLYTGVYGYSQYGFAVYA